MDLTLARLRDLLEYEPETGVFRWKVNASSRRPAGSVAGVTTALGYRKIGIDGSRYYAHRLAWFYVHGRWPAAHLDHVNRSTADNRIANLREATCSQNLANRPAQCNSSHGFKGVTRNKKRWSARININRKYIHLGTFDTPQEAHAAYRAKASELFGEFARAA